MKDPIIPRDWPRYECLQERALRYPDLDVGAVEATLSLLRVSQEVVEGLGAQYERHGISQGRFLVLMILDRYPDQALLPSDLADRIGVTRATITGLVDGLEKDKLVARQPHPGDRRALTVVLTARGRVFLDNMLPNHYRRIAGLMAHLDEFERKDLIRLLGKVYDGADALFDPHWSYEKVEDNTAAAASTLNELEAV